VRGNQRIFIGLKDIANQVTTYAKGFQSLGYRTYTIVWSRNYFYPDAQYDVVIDDVVGPPLQFVDPCLGISKKALYWIKRQMFIFRKFLSCMITCQIFIFFWGTSFLPRYWDYPILKLFGKKIVCVFCGTDIRYWHAYEQEARSLGLEKEVESFLTFLKRAAYTQSTFLFPPIRLRPYIDFTSDCPDDFFSLKARTVRMAERYANLILSKPNMGQLQVRPYMKKPDPLDLSEYRFNVPERQVPVVLHCPSNPEVKGANRIISAVDQLKRGGIRFEFKMVTNVPHSRVRDLLTESDIVVDQLYLGSHSALVAESLATGNVVLSRNSAEQEHTPSDCPVVDITESTVTDRLREAILDRPLRRRLAYAGRRYAEQHHDHLQACKQIITWLIQGVKNYDFTPTFYREKFTMPPDLLEEEARRIHKIEMQLNRAFLSALKVELHSIYRKILGKPVN